MNMKVLVGNAQEIESEFHLWQVNLKNKNIQILTITQSGQYDNIVLIIIYAFVSPLNIKK